jgi:glycosyltransferase involved in cell wall biosynthesis
MSDHMDPRPISVLLVCNTYPPVLGGSEVEAQRVSAALIARGYRVQVVCEGGDPMPPVRDWVDPKGVPVRLYAARWKGKLKDRIFSARVAGMLLRERNKYDVVYFLMQGLHLIPGLPICALLRKPVVMKISGTGVVPLMGKLITGRLELAWLRRWARCVMVLNEHVRQEAIEHGLSPDQLLWMPNPVDTEEFAPATGLERRSLREKLGISATAPVVLYCGRLAPEKGIPLLLEAFARVVTGIPESLLVLVGDGPCRADFEAQVRELNLQRNVRFVGAVTSMEVPSWLNISDVFSLVSPSEGFSCAIAEAMSTGLACVVSDIPANRQLIRGGQEGLLTPVGDATAIAKAILRLLSDAPLRDQLGRAARESIVQNYSTDRVAERYEWLFQSVLGSRRVDFSQHTQGESEPQPGQHEDEPGEFANHIGVRSPS